MTARRPWYAVPLMCAAVAAPVREFAPAWLSALIGLVVGAPLATLAWRLGSKRAEPAP